jgi:Chaperone of endosialidase
MMKGFLNLGLKGCFLIVFVVMQSNFVFGQGNTFYGNNAGASNTSGTTNSFFGNAAGVNNTTGTGNSFFGNVAGQYNNGGVNNTFLGTNAGEGNFVGSNNTMIGARAATLNNSLVNATAIGSYAAVSQNNSLVLGSINGVNLATANTNVGIGTTAPSQTLHVNGNEILSTGPASGFKFRNRNSTSSGDDWVWYSDGNVARFWRAGVGDLLTISTTGVVKLNGLGAPGFSQLCRNGFGEISNCGSSIRFKTNVTSFTMGLDLIRQLRPVSFNWKQNDLYDFGLVAEEVAAVEPLLATYNNKGEVEGVKYDRVGVVLINAVNEQQLQIESQQKQINEQKEIINRQQTQLESLKKLVCSQNSTAELCQ